MASSDRNRRLHVSTAILEWFGYEGEYRKQKEAFLKILRRNLIEYHELTQKDKEIEQYPTIQEELQNPTRVDRRNEGY